MNISLKKALNYLAVFIVFSGALSYDIETIAWLRGSYIIIVICLAFWLIFLRNTYFHKGFIFFFSIIAGISFVSVFKGDDTMTLLLKETAGIFFNALIFYILVKVNNYDTKSLFRIYLRIAFIVALIGIIQEVSYLLEFKPGYDYSGILPVWGVEKADNVGLLRVNSIMPESPFFCIVMLPAFFVSLTSFLKNSFQFQNRLRSIVIITAFFLSFSVIGYIGALFALILLLGSNKRLVFIVVSAVLIWGLVYLGYNKVSVMKIKIDSASSVISGKNSLDRSNLSVYAFFSNALVAYNSFKDSPFFGHGLGSHPVSYDRYIFRERIIPTSIYNIVLCRGDSGSLFLRLMSETGLFGIIVVFAFIIKYHIPRARDGTGYLWVINNAILTMFFMKMIRMGTYFVDGFFFFFWLYYFSKIEADARDKAAQGSKLSRHLTPRP